MLTNAYKRNWTEVKEEESAVVALIEWLPDLTKTTMPYVLLNKLEAKESATNPLDGSELKSLSENVHEDLDEHVLSDLVQWSDLIIFDYLTGNYDRVASMQVCMKILCRKSRIIFTFHFFIFAILLFFFSFN